MYLFTGDIAYRGVDLVVIPQPDGSVACIPEWMTHEQAAQIKLSAEPCFQLEILRSMRAEVDALLAFLPSESMREKDGHEAQSREARTATGTVRSGRTERRAGASHGRRNWSMLVETLLLEIAVALAAGEDGDDQDHR